jgi:hypothetical protein
MDTNTDRGMDTNTVTVTLFSNRGRIGARLDSPNSHLATAWATTAPGATPGRPEAEALRMLATSIEALDTEAHTAIFGELHEGGAQRGGSSAA